MLFKKMLDQGKRKILPINEGYFNLVTDDPCIVQFFIRLHFLCKLICSRKTKPNLR